MVEISSFSVDFYHKDHESLEGSGPRNSIASSFHSTSVLGGDVNCRGSSLGGFPVVLS